MNILIYKGAVFIFLSLFAVGCTSVSPSLERRKTSNVKGKENIEVRQILTYVEENTDIAQLLFDHNLKLVRKLLSDSNGYVFSAPDYVSAKRSKERMEEDQRVKRVFLNVPVFLKANYIPRGEYARDQWHLRKEPYNNWPIINVHPAWNAEITGEGVAIGIVDSGVEYDHEDLAQSYLASESYDFVDLDSDAYPWQEVNGLSFYTSHGTAVAGIATASGDNNRGISSVAPHAKFSALRIPLQNTWDTGAPVELHPNFSDRVVDAIQYRDMHEILTPEDDPDSPHAHGKKIVQLRVKNHSYGNPRRFLKEDNAIDAQIYALEESTRNGMIHVTSAGNNRESAQQDTNKSGLGRVPELIFVAAVGCHGKYSTYSNYGANIFVSAPSSSGLESDGICGSEANTIGIVSTDAVNHGYNLESHLLELGFSENPSDPFEDHKYTSIFGGTSAAAPIVSGVIALGIQSQPKLDTRFVKHLLARTSKIIDEQDYKNWSRNTAGLDFNPNYGFGLIDASAFTNEAANYSGVSERQVFNPAQGRSVDLPIPVSCTSTASSCFLEKNIQFNTHQSNSLNSVFVSERLALEEVIVTLDIEHPYRGLLSAELISPGGTKSRLFKTDLDDTNLESANNMNDDDWRKVQTQYGIMQWPFVTNAFWGESPMGNWKVRLYYSGSVNFPGMRKWNSVSLQFNTGDLEQ